MRNLAAAAESSRIALENDLITFATIVEDTARPIGNADGWQHPAATAAQGLAAGWEAVVTPSNGEHQLPELHRRVTTYLGKVGVKDGAELRPSLESLTLAAPDILLAVYQRLPRQRRKDDFVEGVIQHAEKIKDKLPVVAHKDRKKIVKGMKWVLSVPAAFSR